MSMTKCKECGNEVSDKAFFCPRCGILFEGKKMDKLKAMLIIKMGKSQIDWEVLILILFMFLGFSLLALAMILN